MIRLLPALVATILPAAASADQVLVRSGEHPGFSRLVLEFDERPQWSLSVENGRARVLLSPDDWSFDTARVFARIPRTRITDVAEGPGGLEISLGCDCKVTAFEVRRAALAIDVETPSPLEEIRNLRSTSSDGSDAAEPTAPFPPPAIVDTAPTTPRPPDSGGEPRMGTWAVADAPDRARLAPPPPSPAREAAPPPADAPPHWSDPVLTEVAEGIARAVTQGVLDLAPQTRETPAGRLLDLPPRESTNLRLRLADEEIGDPGAADPGELCRGDAAFDVASWGPGEQSPAEALSARRAALAPDLDTIDEDRAADLARLYVSLGFGAEARAVLDAMAPRHPDAKLLRAMADTLDGVPPSPDVFETEENCPGRAQLWVGLATGIPTDPEDVTVAVSELPLVLRRHVGPRLIDLFLTNGDQATAEAIRAAVGRAAGPHGAPFDLAAARLDADRQVSSALASLRTLADEPSPASDEALATLLEYARDSGSPVDPASLARAEMRAEDLRGTAEGARLEIGLVHGFLVNGDGGEAASRLRRAMEGGRLREIDVARLARATLSELARNGSDEEVLVHAAAFRGDVSEMVRGDSAGELVAARLLDLGLPELARHYLPSEPNGRDGARALAARLSLLTGDPEAALSLLDEMTHRGPDELRTMEQALRSLGRTEDAAEVRRALADGEAEGKDPQETTTPAIPVLPTTEPGATDEPRPAAGEAGSPRQLVVASEAVRQEVDALLSAYPRP